jgi:uncharacterized protein (TIGR03083 family)
MPPAAAPNPHMSPDTERRYVGDGGIMNRDAVWHAIDEQRLGLVELLDGLSESDWMISCLCARWTVKDVAAHVALQNSSWWSLPRMSLDLVRAGGLNGAIHRAARRHAQRSSNLDIIAQIRDRIGVWHALPTLTYQDTAVDYLVHSQDISLVGELARWYVLVVGPEAV